MRWSWQVATIRGIGIKLHVTFLLALAWGAYLWGTGSVGSALYGVFLTILLFGVVLLHELGHALVAQRYGIEVYDIILLPIGGVARLSEMPENPRQELAVAAAGPAVNLILALLMLPAVVGLLALQVLAGRPLAWPPVGEPGLVNLAAFMFMVNVSLLVFNLLPAFPMDGGRMLRALMAMRWRYRRATQVAVIIGRIFAIGFGALAIYSGNVFLGMVAVFVFAGAGAEGRETQAPGRIPVVPLDLVAGRSPVLRASMPAYIAFEHLVRSPYPALTVIDERGDLVGLVTRTGMETRWAAGLRGPVGLFVEPINPFAPGALRAD